MTIKEHLEKYSVAGAIIVAGLLIAGAVLFTNQGADNGKLLGNIQPGDEVPESNQPATDAYKNVKPVTNEDHILGNKDAKIKIVNFSDMECPYCITFDATMKKVVADYNGDVAWVYRQSPLDFHQNARPAAEASECAAEIGGNDKFWAFLEKAIEKIQEASGEVNMTDIAVSAGVDKTAFENCYGKGKFDSKIADHIADSLASGLEGTPYSVVVVDGAPVTTINGAYPIEDVKNIVNQYLK
jgi:protein-disulfide isomerase